MSSALKERMGQAQVLPARPRKGALARSEARSGAALVAPSVVIVLILVVVPIIWTINLAFQDLRLINLRRSGLFGQYTLENFALVFTSPGFWQALGTTLVYSVIGTGGAVVCGLIAAMALRRPFRGRTFVRACVLLPYVAPIVAVTFVWKTLLNPQYGIVNQWGMYFGWEDPIAFLSQRSHTATILGMQIDLPIALITVIVFEIWRTLPFAFLFIMARLEAIPNDIEEAALVDGASVLQRFRHVVLPQLWSTIAVLTMLRFIWTFNAFDEVYLLTGGRAGTEVVSVRVFDFLIGRGDIGTASAQALVLAGILILLVLIYTRFVARNRSES
jgi:multiple sugar transport system permease protein